MNKLVSEYVSKFASEFANELANGEIYQYYPLGEHVVRAIGMRVAQNTISYYTHRDRQIHVVPM